MPSRAVVPLLVAVGVALVAVTALAFLAGNHVSPAVPVTAATDHLATSPGHTVEFPLVATNPLPGNRSLTFRVVDAAGLNATASGALAVPGNGTAVRYLRVDVPNGTAAGDRTLRVLVASGGASQVLQLHLSVAPPKPAVTPGATVLVTFTARLAGGPVFATDDAALANLSVPTTSFYQPPRSFAPVQVSTNASGGLFPLLRQAILGLGVGQSASVTLTPAHGYGNATRSVTFPRVETVNRTFTLQRTYAGPRSSFGGLLNASSRQGDVVHAPLQGMNLPLVIANLTPARAVLQLDVHAGDRFTQVPAWPDGVRVTNVTSSLVVLRRTPGTAPGVAFTYHAGWANATEVVNVTSSVITLRSSPQPGTNFTRSSATGTTTYTVDHLTSANVVATAPNPSPLAGKTVVFDITVRSVR